MTSSWTPKSPSVRWFVLAALVPFVVVAIARWGQPPSASDGDYAQYLLHAKAIAEFRPYSDIGYIYTSMNLVGPPVQPPGWPLVLAPFVAVFGTHSPVFRLLTTLLVAAFGVTAGVCVSRRFGGVAGIATAAMVPLALETQYATVSPLSDPLFCVLVWVALLVADGEGPPTWRRGIMLAVLSVAALSVRVAGVALAPAIMLHAALRWRREGLKVVLPIAALGAVAAVVGLFIMDSIPFGDRILGSFSRAPQLVTFFVRSYTQAIATSVLYPLGSNTANDAWHVFAAVPLLVGAFLFVRRHAISAMGCFLFAYVAVLVLSPVREPRYAWPLYPLMAAWLVIGLTWLSERLFPATLKPAAPRFVLGFVGLVSVGAAVQLMRIPARPSLLGDPNTISLFDFLKATNDSSEIRVVFTNPRVLTLETGIPAMGIPNGADTAVIAELSRKRITHVVAPRTNFTRTAERNLVKIVGDHPAQFPTVFENASHDVYRFVLRPEAQFDSGSRMPNQN